MMHIGLLGFGVVGGGVWALCAPRDDLNVKRVLLRSPKEGLPEEVVTFNADDILNDPEIDTVVEVMGGLHPAYEYVSAALARGQECGHGQQGTDRRLLHGAHGTGPGEGRGPALHRRRGRRHTLADEFGAREAAGYGVCRGRYYERHHQLYHGRHAPRLRWTSLPF